ncbi:hypothetical protein DFH09DRAFT_1076953 [Mycena vulgaris]|nr:hypothetical protein DFH09DRAFT_1076953 [Mycena vulgaris]
MCRKTDCRRLPLTLPLYAAASILRQNPFAHTMLFLQIAFILIGVFASIGRDQLSNGDEQFAVILTHSPTCAYYVLLVLPRLKLLPTEPAPAWNQLMTELNCQLVADGLCAALIVLIFLALNISVQYNGLTHLHLTEDS